MTKDAHLDKQAASAAAAANLWLIHPIASQANLLGMESNLLSRSGQHACRQWVNEVVATRKRDGKRAIGGEREVRDLQRVHLQLLIVAGLAHEDAEALCQRALHALLLCADEALH